ncbi:MAG: RNA-directed DNA polymerase [Butyrivibrio sp.]|nr:RNA-directed DNA polymerase [Butyrivibrio sp.]
MHYVLLWWFKETIQPKLRGYSNIVVYADDFVVCFQYKEDAEVFYERLKRRMGNFGLSLEEEKSRLIEFGRFASENCAKRGAKPETFSFLGFTHYCSHSRNGKFRVKRKTSRKKFSKKLKDIHRKIGEMRSLKTKDIVKKLNEILVGYFHYYGITDNSHSIKSFRYEVMKSLFYWLNRRSQRKSYNWADFLKMLDYCHPLTDAKICVSIYA